MIRVLHCSTVNSQSPGNVHTRHRSPDRPEENKTELKEMEQTAIPLPERQSHFFSSGLGSTPLGEIIYSHKALISNAYFIFIAYLKSY